MLLKFKMLNNNHEKQGEKLTVAQKIIDFEERNSTVSTSRILETQSCLGKQMQVNQIMFDSMCLKNFAEAPPPKDHLISENENRFKESTGLTEVSIKYSPRTNSTSFGSNKKNCLKPMSSGTTGIAIQNDNKTSEKKPLKQFLKKGDGLKQRFRVDPNAYKLNNLPKYKYSGAHPHLRFKGGSTQHLKLKKKEVECTSYIPTSDAKNKTDYMNQQQQLGKEIDLGTLSTFPKDENYPKNFINSNTVFCSTPEIKTSGYDSTDINYIRNSTEKIYENEKNTNLDEKQDLLSTNCNAPMLRSLSNITPLDVQKVDLSMLCVQQDNKNRTQEDIDTLQMFEYLEEKVKEYNIDSSYMDQVWKGSCDFEKVQIQMEASHRMQDTVSVKGTESSAHTETNSDFYTTDDDSNAVTGNKFVQKKYLDSEEESVINMTNVAVLKKEVNHLDNVSTAGDSAREKHINTPFIEVDPSSKDNSVIEHFRDVLFRLLNQRAAQVDGVKNYEDNIPENFILKINPDKDTTSGEENFTSFGTMKVVEVDNVKTDQEKQQLENEYICFKEANRKLTKMKQIFELEKSIFEQERQDTLKEIHDLKIKFETYMHDERMKVEEEKRKVEQQLRTQRLTKQNKDRILVLQLKDEVGKLTMQLKQKEQNHMAAQARLRAQVAKMEKEQKVMLDEIEQLKKENKRLESECIRVEREKNNKLLDEINKNIAKLAPKLCLKDVCSMSNVQDSSEILEQIKKPFIKNSSGKAQGSINSSELKRSKIKKIGAPINTPNCEISSDGEKGEKTTQEENLRFQGTTVINDPLVFFPKEYSDKMSYVCPMTVCQATSTTNLKHTLAENKHSKTVSASTSTEFNREIINPDGSKDIWYSNGNIKKLSADRMHIKMLYFNKDIKETDIEKGTIRYYYASTNTWHTTYLDGLEILEFPNGQTEHRLKNGVIETHFPNHSIKIVDPNNKEVESEWHFEDGTKLKHMRNGDKVLILSNGQREIHTQKCKRREYPDGTIKIVYPDGSQETRYSNGRVRLKDRDGKLVMDSDNAVCY